MFLDNSNTWIEAKRFFGKKLNNELYVEDSRVRIDPEKLEGTIRGTRKVEKGILYGSGI